MTSKITILICGATGKQGGAAINSLLESPQSSSLELRFLTRNPDSGSSKKLTARGAKAYKGDLLDSAALEAALSGVDRAFLVTDPLGGVDKEEKMGKNFVDAANKSGVKHLVFTSVCAADTATQVPHFNSKYQIEKYIIASGISYTFLRPVAFMDNFPYEAGLKQFLGVGLFFALAAWKPVAMIAVEDIGIFGSKALLDPEDQRFKNQTIDLSVGEYDHEDIRKAYGKASGGVPWVATYLPTQLVYLLPYDFKKMMLYFREGGYPKVDLSALKQIHPDMMSFEEWVRKNSKSKSQ